jgi:hypothetical protein
LTVPITSSEAERSFSCLKRLKTWLRTTIGQIRLSSLAIIYMNAPKLKNLDINLLTDIFATKKQRRKDFF